MLCRSSAWLVSLRPSFIVYSHTACLQTDISAWYADALIVSSTGASLHDNNDAAEKVTTQYGRR